MDSGLLTRLQVHPIRVPNPHLVEPLNQLYRAFPVARQLQAALRVLGSDYSFAHSANGYGYALVKLHPELERRLALEGREVALCLAPFADLQKRALDSRLPVVANTQRGRVADHVSLLWSPDPTAAAKVDRWLAKEAFEVVVVDADGTAEEVAWAMLKGLVSQLSQHNPFQRNNPVTGHDFFGRRDALRRLIENLRQGLVAGVFGLRKTGKASLVKELGNQWESAAPSQRAFMLRDFENLPGQASEKVGRACSDIAAQFWQQSQSLGTRTHEVAELPNRPDVGQLRRALSACLSHKQTAGSSFVLALDEIESLVPAHIKAADAAGAEVPEFLGTIRSLVQENDNFNVILSGLTSALLTLSRLGGRENPLFAWAQPLYLGNLTLSEVDAMLTSLSQRAASRWTSAAIESAHRIAGGHVFLTRSLAADVTEQMHARIEDRTVSVADVEARYRSWRRNASGVVDGMLEGFRDYYAEAGEALDVARQDEAWLQALDDEEPALLQTLLSLGLVIDSGETLEVASWVGLGSR